MTPDPSLELALAERIAELRQPSQKRSGARAWPWQCGMRFPFGGQCRRLRWHKGLCQR